VAYKEVVPTPAPPSPRRLPPPATLAAALLAAGLVAAPAVALERVAGPPAVTTLVTGLEVPWDVAFLPDGRALVTERGGRVRIVDAAGRLQAEPAAVVDVSTRGDGGLLGVAVDPAFGPDAPFVYLTHTTLTEVRVSRWRLTGDRLTSEGTVVAGITAGGVHASARVRFGPDGAMYVGTGDAGDAARAQRAGSLNGKLLRVAPGAYRGGRVTPAVVASGLRHPQGMAWQPGTGAMFVTDHGPSDFDGPSGDDELNLIAGGGNYGWPLRRGADQSPYLSPVHLWTTTIAPASIAFVALPGSTWTGDALVTGLRGQVLRRLTFSGARVIADEPLLRDAHGRLRAVAEAPDGSIWVTTSNRDGRGDPRTGDDRILRIVPPVAPAVAPAAAAPLDAAPRPRVRRAVLRRLAAPAQARLGVAVAVAAHFTRPPGAAVALQARVGEGWRNLTAVHRPGARVRLVFQPRALGITRLRVRVRSGGRVTVRGLTMVVVPRETPVPATWFAAR